MTQQADKQVRQSEVGAVSIEESESEVRIYCNQLWKTSYTTLHVPQHNYTCAYHYPLNTTALLVQHVISPKKEICLNQQNPALRYEQVWTWRD